MTAIATVNDVPVISGEIKIPRCGVWFADLRVEVDKAIEGEVSISVDDGRLVLKGTARRTGLFMETAVLRVLGGAGSLATVVPAKWYRSISGRIVASEILEAAGERLAESSDSGILGASLDGYCRVRQPAARALSRLTDYLGAIWRVLPDGSIWIGAESWPDAGEVPRESIRISPQTSFEEFGVEGVSLLPGRILDGRKISLVEHSISVDALRTVVGYEPEDVQDTDEDRQTRANRAIVERFTGAFDFYAEYRARVVSQNSDGTLELKPNDPRLPGLTKVPIRHGLPGVSVKVAAGAFVLVHFEDGDPTLPVAGLWDPGSLNELTIEAAQKITLNVGAGGTAKIEAGAGGKVEVLAGAGGTVSVDPGVGGSIKLGGDGAVLSVAMQGDTAGPFPLVCKGMMVKAKLGP